MTQDILRIFIFLATMVHLQTAFPSPNFIVILVDDLGWSSLSTSMDKRSPDARSDYYKTPNIDALIDMGMRFSNGYAASPVCAPTRYSLQFGKTPARIGITRGLGPNNAEHDQIGIPQLLKRIDPRYRTAHLGKWHIDEDPSRYGYDLHDGITKNNPGGFTPGNQKRQWTGYAEKDPKRIESLTNRAIEFLRDSVTQERPFFLQLSHYAVHSDIVFSDTSFDATSTRLRGSLHSNAGYAAMLEDLDDSIGVFLQSFENLDLSSNTYIFFTSDNGGMPILPQKTNLGMPYKSGLNSPLLRGKWDLTEGGIRVPFAVIGPGIEEHSQVDTPVVTYDILPTIYELVSGSTDGLPEGLDGGSLIDLITGKSGVVERHSEYLVFHYPHYNRVGINEPHSSIRDGNIKLIRFPVSQRNLLFDLGADPGERNNLAVKQKDLVDALDSELTNYLLLVDAERPEEAFNWRTTGQSGRVRTFFFQRYEGK